MTSHKQDLANAFREISTLETNFYKSKAYLNAVRVIENMSDEEFMERKSFLNIPGIGMSINTKILDFKSKGELPAKLFHLREENKSYLDPSIYKVRKGFITKRIPYEEAKEFVTEIERISFRGANISSDKIFFLGSFRRKKSLIADIDVLVLGEDNYINLVRTLKEFNYNVIVEGPQKTSFVFDNQEKTSMDITWCDKRSLPFSILHFTGSSASNIRLRAKAKSMGYSLNQYGFSIIREIDENSIEDRQNKLNDSVFNTEEDIFNFLNEPYVKPENR